MLSGTHLDHLFYMVTWSPGPPGLHGLHAPPGPYGIHGLHCHLVYMLHLVTWSPVPGEHSFQFYLFKEQDTQNQNKKVSTGSVLGNA